jgi:hypothetical protein
MSVAAWPTVGSTLGLTRFSWQTKGALGPHDRIVLEQRVTCSQSSIWGVTSRALPYNELTSG